MPGLRTHIVLLCIAGYLVAVESRILNLIINDAAFGGNPVENTYRAKNSKTTIVKWLLMVPMKDELNIEKEKQKAIKEIAAEMLKINRNDDKGHNMDALRYADETPTIRGFLQSLNNFLNQNTNKNNYGEKRDVCNSGFGNPGSRNMCKRDKSRQFLTGNSRGKSRRQYAQHMIEERARDSDSESSSDESEDNDSDDDRQARKEKKSRYEIVDNIQAKGKLEDSTESEEQVNIESKPYQSSDSEDDESDKTSSDSSVEQERKKPKRTKSYSESESEEQREDSSESEEGNNSDSSDNSEGIEETDNYMYLQGTRLQKPNLRSQDYKKSGRRDPNRLPYFLPKQYNWDPDMIHDVTNFWNAGIGVHHRDYLISTFNDRYSK